ncbi:uncharacterized protein PFL1_04579 [Pseudozyma flocculosa PF-1]|uniref:CUE domain-containing protein n=1 Tax=Pseudozyma flocculosa PF-1 TaxID=1277687 RepID=A0A061H5V1_9BASI|nr:uncharacterized protein PFL1_04579 [Pseudozyma flocculosa PF-1]EPQ27834.1 hypothetical protein PFL1_04579 [Pseudozyma flocculosa PF-1]
MVSGFAHAPISKGLIVTTAISTVVLSVFRFKPYTHLQVVPHLSVHGQYWRLVAHHVAFANASELFLATLFFYTASREVERRFGTLKFASFLAITLCLYTALVFVLLVLFTSLPDAWPVRVLLPAPLRVQGRTPSGPFAPLFVILYQHARIVPDRWVIRIGSVYVGDRAIQIWSLALLLILSQPSMTPFVGLLAMATSALYRSDLLLSSSLKSYRIPKRLYRVLAYLLSGLVGSTRTPTRSWRAEPPPPPSFRARQARREQMQSAIDGARDERARRTSAVLQSVGGLRMRFGAAAPPSPGERRSTGILPTTRGGDEAGTASTRAERVRTDEMIGELLQSMLQRTRSEFSDGRDANAAGAPRTGSSAAGADPGDAQPGSHGALRDLLAQLTQPHPDTAITEPSIRALQAMFPHLPRSTLVEALQQSNGSQPDAVERLLIDSAASPTAPG